METSSKYEHLHEKNLDRGFLKLTTILDVVVKMKLFSNIIVKSKFWSAVLEERPIFLFFFFFFFNKFIYLFILAVLGLHFCARALSSCGKRGSLFIAVRGPLTIAASPVAEHRLQTRRLSSCGSRAQLLPGMWDPPRPGLEPVSPALAGRFSTTVPPGKPSFCSLYYKMTLQNHYPTRNTIHLLLLL